MEIKMVKVEDLKPYVNNPRLNDDAVEYVANSIKQFGFKVPMVIDKDKVIVAGHTRYKASLELGLQEVPCIVADDLTEEQIKAFRLADNKVSELADWNIELLDEELNDLDIDMSEFGFDKIEDIFDTDFTLESGEKKSLVNMVFSLTQEQADYVEDIIKEMQRTKEYKEFDYIENKNSNGNSLFLICKQWEKQKK